MCLHSLSFLTVSPSNPTLSFCWTRSSTYLFSTERLSHSGVKLDTMNKRGTRTSRSCWRLPLPMPRYVSLSQSSNIDLTLVAHKGLLVDRAPIPRYIVCDQAG